MIVEMAERLIPLEDADASRVLSKSLRSKGVYGISLPEKEISILAMYVKQCSIYTEPKPMIGVVVTSYGLVAKSMVDVASRLFERKHAQAVELYWNDDLAVSVERIVAQHVGVGLESSLSSSGVKD